MKRKQDFGNDSAKHFSRFLSSGFSVLGPFFPGAVFLCAGLLIFAVFRAALYINNYSVVSPVDHSLLVFPIGVRMDLILLSYLAFPLFLLLLILPAKVVREVGAIFSFYLACAASIFVFMEMATFPFMAEFGSRPDRLFVEHIADFREVPAMVLKGYPAEVLLAVVLTGLCFFLVWRLFQKIFRECLPYSPFKRTFLFFLVVPLLFLGARSSIGHRPANISTAAFSRSHLVNQLGLNSTYAVLYAWYQTKKHEKDPRKFYGRMDADRMVDQVLVASGIAGTGGTDTDKTLFHYQEAGFQRERPLNLVIILEESLGAEYVGCLGGLPLTPNIDQLSRDGVLLTQLYATGTRTVRAIEALICGFLPTPGSSVVKLERSQRGFFTLAGLLSRKGYATEFVYGGNAQFDNMRAFFLANGFQNIYEQKHFEQPVFQGTWGVSDEDLFQKANDVFKSHDDKPFFALVLTTSNHDPFEFPDGRIELYEQPKRARHNAMKYADYALGRFFDRAKKEKYYKNTVFLVVADHSTRLRGQDLIPVDKFHIPGLIIGPGVSPGKYEKICSQVDMPTTLLDIMGVNAVHPFIGRPLFSLPKNVPGRAVMQYGDVNAYVSGNKVVVNRPEMDPCQYVYRNGCLIPSEPDPELFERALAHALLPGYLYHQGLYSSSGFEKSPAVKKMVHNNNDKKRGS